MMGIERSKTGRRVLRRALTAFGLVLFTGTASAAIPSVATLEDVDVATLSGGQVRLGFQFEGGPPEHQSFTSSDPARIVVQEVCHYNLKVIVGSMGKRSLPVNISQCPNAFNSGATLIVYFDITFLIGFNASSFQI